MLITKETKLEIARKHLEEGITIKELLQAFHMHKTYMGSHKG